MFEFFDFDGSCNVGALLENKARSHCLMLVLRGRIIRSFRFELGCYADQWTLNV